MRRAEGGKELAEELFSAGAVQQGGGAVGGGGVPHAQHTEPQLRRGARSRGGWEVVGEVHRGGGRAELKRGDEVGGVARRGRQNRRVREQAPREEQLQAVVGGVVVLEVGGGVRVGAVIEGARHSPLAGGMVLGA